MSDTYWNDYHEIFPQNKQEDWGYTEIRYLNTEDRPESPDEALKRCKQRSRFGQECLLLETDDEQMTYSADYFTIADHPGSRGAIEEYESGRCAHYNSLSDGMIACLATREFVKLMSRFSPEEFSPENPEFMGYAKTQALNPYFRQALALAANTQVLTEQVRANCAQANVRLNEYLLQQTLAPVDDDRRDGLLYELKNRELVEPTVEKNRLSQMTCAKTLFLMQFGGVHTMQNNGANAEYQGSMTELLAHGGRTKILLGKGAPGQNTLEKKLFHDIRGRDKGTSVYGRSFASHAMEPTGRKPQAGADAYRESLSVTLSDNYGMNIGIGGVGNLCDGKTILPGGNDGHIYLKKVESTAESGGTMLIGFESEAPGMTGRTGHKHSIKADPSKISPFMSNKNGPGAKINGRAVDLSLWKPEAIGALLDAFAEKYGELQDLANRRIQMDDPADLWDKRQAATDKLNRLNAMLTGKAMTPQQFKSFMVDELGIPTVNINGKEVGIDKLVNDQQKYSKMLFELMNTRAHNNTIRRQPVSERDRAMEKIAFRPDQQYRQISAVLKKTKDKLFHVIDLGDSDKMKKIKESLMNVAVLSEDPHANAYIVHQALSALKEATKAYIDDPKKALNERMKLVRKLDELTEKQLQKLDEMVPQHRPPHIREPQRGLW